MYRAGDYYRVGRLYRAKASAVRSGPQKMRMRAIASCADNLARIRKKGVTCIDDAIEELTKLSDYPTQVSLYVEVIHDYLANQN